MKCNSKSHINQTGFVEYACAHYSLARLQTHFNGTNLFLSRNEKKTNNTNFTYAVIPNKLRNFSVLREYYKDQWKVDACKY